MSYPTRTVPLLALAVVLAAAVRPEQHNVRTEVVQCEGVEKDGYCCTDGEGPEHPWARSVKTAKNFKACKSACEADDKCNSFDVISGGWISSTSLNPCRLYMNENTEGARLGKLVNVHGREFCYKAAS
mmetsp:Transcript_838/g.1625  ORF Transcript_838/g.1625 Transcript_838/m.1625 type:complete len:128 (-) Transcript_838:159-542(-)|eukprot:CAMPEP_0197650674 /NCGR_PEP_ID=MMETSP1338-20131121/31089_1 /TAXON_ID=43686 ORGANISM="Pelagodinium beii, Strain RCC1491" /NCGR_SAMPLE_ID=MMETSP1338 /ASSEMBLY_ACC=CAM_ASM_000754 /LENGTH=127 /DNA_ID=CAMNT_0043225129 /DNA_START=47 /DNA_END=430 /DNA_ORIENTATION=-